jgi:calcium-dependent protein kinase
MPFGGRNEAEIRERILIGKYWMYGIEWEHVSERAKDLVKRMLEVDSKKRISAEEAYNHPWVQNTYQETQIDKDSLRDAFANLRSFRAENKLQRAVLCFISSQLVSQKERSNLSKIFQTIDKDGTGKLNAKELKLASNRLANLGLTEDELQEIINRVDSNQNGYIDYQEFLIAALNKEKLLSKERLEAAFKAFDIDGSGKISSSELREMLEMAESPDEAWEQVIREVDQNGDGEVDLKEFKEMMLSMI